MPKRRPAGVRRPSALGGTLPVVAATLLGAGCAVSDVGPVASPEPSPPARTLHTPATLLGLPRSAGRLPAELPRFRLNELTARVSPATSTAEATYGGGRPDTETIVISAASGTDADPEATLTELLLPYRLPKVRTVELGRFGGEARCGRGRTADAGHLTACAWADPQVVGVVVFLTAAKQPDRKADFLTIRDELERPAG